jgi:hypothetical protein
VSLAHLQRTANELAHQLEQPGSRVILLRGRCAEQPHGPGNNDVVGLKRQYYSKWTQILQRLQLGLASSAGWRINLRSFNRCHELELSGSSLLGWLNQMKLFSLALLCVAWELGNGGVTG